MTAPTAPAPDPPAYPVHIDAELDPDLSRGLWLVKWFLAIPHYVVLAVLWVAFAVTTAVVLVSILSTGKYPRALFDFNVGVMRWSWRVGYYSCSALGTDRYPPFSLADVPDYPAHLDVDHPEHLSRGLALVKWWLLAIPHYLVVGLFVGGIGYGTAGVGDDPELSISLLGILVLVAGFALLVTGTYPRPLFDLLLGINRWVLRVAAYASLMTDRYPPFRLDQGGHEPGATGHHVQPPESRPDARRSAPGGWTAGRVVSLVLGCLLTLTSLTVAGAGATLAFVDRDHRDPTGFLMSSTEDLSTPGYAISSTDGRVDTGKAPEWLPDVLVGDVRLEATSVAGDTLFIGIASSADAAVYLAGVRHDTLEGYVDDQPVYRTTAGGPPSSLPGDEPIWIAADSGASPSLTWDLTEGRWTAVLMNADGSSPVSAAVRLGVEAPALRAAIGFLLLLAGLLLVGGAALLVVPVRLASRPTGPRTPGSAPTSS